MSNPYQSPGFQPPSYAPHVDGGSLDAALNGEYDFDLNEVLAEAWAKTDGAKSAFFGAFVAIFIVSLVAGLVRGLLIGNDQSSQFLGTLLLLPIVGPMYMGVFMMGVRRAADMPILASDVFRYLSPYNLQIVIAQVMIYVLTMLGFILLVLPGIYAMVSYIFAAPLVADKGLAPWDALETSRKSLGHHWWKLFGFVMALGFIVLLSCIPLLIGLIWTVPMTAIAMGIVYRKIFGFTLDPGL